MGAEVVDRQFRLHGGIVRHIWARISPSHVHTDPSDGQRHRRAASGAQRVYSKSNVPSRRRQLVKHHSASEGAQWLRRETTQHQRLNLGRLEVDYLQPDRNWPFHKQQ